MKTFTSLIAILLAAAPLTGCVGAETDDDMSYEDAPEAQGDAEAEAEDSAEAEPTAEDSAALLSSWDEQMYTDDAAPGGRVRFETDGDIVELCDIEADGYAVYLSVYDDTAKRSQYTYTIGGEGRCQTFRASLGGKYDLPEKHTFRFRICLVRDGKNSYCDDAYWKNINR